MDSTLRKNIGKIRTPSTLKKAIKEGNFKPITKLYKKIYNDPEYDKSKSLPENSIFQKQGTTYQEKNYFTLQLIEELIQEGRLNEKSIGKLIDLGANLGLKTEEKDYNPEYGVKYDFSITSNPIAEKKSLRGRLESIKAQLGEEISEEELLEQIEEGAEETEEILRKELGLEKGKGTPAKIKKMVEEGVEEIESQEMAKEDKPQEETKEEEPEEEREEAKEPEQEVIEEYAEELAETKPELKVAEQFVGEVLEEGMKKAEEKINIDLEKEVERLSKEFPTFDRDEIRATLRNIYATEYPEVEVEEGEPPAPTEPDPQPEPRKIKETTVPRDPQPSLLARVPPERFGVTGKSVEQIIDDILYFKKQFPQQTKNIRFNRRNRNRRYVESIHKRIEAKLRGSPMLEKKVGVVISGEDFIKDKLKEIIMENSIQGLTAQDLIINIEGKPDDPKGKDAGAYEIKRAPDGKESAQREPVYRYIPEVVEKKERRGKIPTPQTKYRNPEQTAKKQFRNDPFRSKQPSIRLKYLY